MKPPLAIRDATTSDLEQILIIEQASPSAAHWNSNQYRQRIEQGKVIVAVRGDVICGFLCARVAAGEWEIENVVVGENCRRQGIARVLIDELVNRWANSDGVAMLLEVRESNSAARALYEKAGFHEVGRRPRYYPDPVEDAILYSRLR